MQQQQPRHGKSVYRNKFIKDDPMQDISPEDAKNYKKYYIQKIKANRAPSADSISQQDYEDDNIDIEDLLETNRISNGEKLRGRREGFGESGGQGIFDASIGASLGLSQPSPNVFLPFNLQSPQQRQGEYEEEQKKVIKRERKTVVNIDSRERDTEEYADANHFKITLERAFLNVKSVSLVSSEFPNSDQPVKSTPTSLQNNQVIWINQEDRAFGLTPLFPVYTATLTPGNYTASTIIEEMTLKMNTVKRSTVAGSGTGVNHFFDMSVNLDTDIVKVYQLALTNLTDNPINTFIDDATISVYQLGHTFAVGDTVFLNGVKGFCGGIAPYDLNGYHTVTATTQNGSSYNGPMVINELNNVIDFVESGVSKLAALTRGLYATPTALATEVQTALNAAGDLTYTVSYDTGDNNKFIISATGVFSLLFLTGANRAVSSAATLGYSTAADLTLADTYTATNVVPNSVFQFELDVGAGVGAGSVFTDVAGSNGVRTGVLMPFKFLFGTYTATIGKILGYLQEDSSLDIATPNIDQLTTYAGTITSASILTGPARISFTSATHGLVTGDIVAIYDVLTVPAIASSADLTFEGVSNIFTVTVTGANTFTVPLTGVSSVNISAGSPRWGSSKINVNYTTHGLSTGNTVRLYRAVAIGGIRAVDINNIAYTVTVINANNFSFAVGNKYATSAVAGGGGSYIRISSYNASPATLHGFSGLQSNTSDGAATLNTEVNLGGQDYVLLTCPQLKTLETSKTKIVTNIFAKILLTGVSGSRLYNTFVSNPKTFDDVPQNRIDILEFSVYFQSGDLFNFHGLDYSFSLEITELIDEIRNVGFSSRRGLREIINQAT